MLVTFSFMFKAGISVFDLKREKKEEGFPTILTWIFSSSKSEGLLDAETFKNCAIF